MVEKKIKIILKRWEESRCPKHGCILDSLGTCLECNKKIESDNYLTTIAMVLKGTFNDKEQMDKMYEEIRILGDK